MPAGRPTDFKLKYPEMLIEYFDIPPHRKELVSKSEAYDKKTGEVSFKKEEWKKVPNELPTLYKFAKKIKIDESTLLDWVHKGDSLKEANNNGQELTELEKGFVRFSNAYETAKRLYKQFLIANGLENLYNGAFAIFVAKNTTDMRDVTESKVNLSGSISLSKLLNEAKQE